MSLFGTSPTEGSPTAETPKRTRPRSSLFDDDDGASPGRPTASALFQDDDDNNGGGGSPWDMPTPRKPQSRGDLLRTLLPASDVPESYVDVFDAVVRDDGDDDGRIAAGGVARTLAAAHLGADDHARIMGLVAPSGGGSDFALGKDEFNVLLALVGLAQEGEHISLDAVDERRRGELHHHPSPTSILCPHPPPLIPAASLILSCRSTEAALN